MSTVLAIIMVFGGLYALYWLRRWDKEDTSGVVYPDRNNKKQMYNLHDSVSIRHNDEIYYDPAYSSLACNVWHSDDTWPDNNISEIFNI